MECQFETSHLSIAVSVISSTALQVVGNMNLRSIKVWTKTRLYGKRESFQAFALSSRTEK